MKVLKCKCLHCGNEWLEKKESISDTLLKVGSAMSAPWLHPAWKDSTKRCIKCGSTVLKITTVDV